MKTLEQYLGEYGHYHRDQRNIYTHYAGIPLIVFSVFCLLSKPAFLTDVPLLGETIVSPAIAVWVIGNLFYFKLDKKLGSVMALITAVMVYFAQSVAALGVIAWLSVSLGIFVGGWALQFVGHHFEGKKPAFVDDIMGLAIGPLFVLAEVAFEMGLRNKLKQDIEQRCGPIRH
jgi:uncharacterized membrane protein YGL010W